MTASVILLVLLLLLAVVSTIVSLTNAYPNYYLRTSNEDYPSTKTNKTRRMIAVGSFYDDIANAVRKAPWDILFTEGFEACMDDEGCRAFAKIFITLIIMMVCVGGYWCYKNDRNDRRVTAQEEQNSS
jgi:hypothetical protein